MHDLYKIYQDYWVHDALRGILGVYRGGEGRAPQAEAGVAAGRRGRGARVPAKPVGWSTKEACPGVALGSGSCSPKYLNCSPKYLNCGRRGSQGLRLLSPEWERRYLMFLSTPGGSGDRLRRKELGSTVPPAGALGVWTHLSGGPAAGEPGVRSHGAGPWALLSLSSAAVRHSACSSACNYPPGELTSGADVWPPFLEAGWLSLGQGPGVCIVMRAPGWGPPAKHYPVAASSWRHFLNNNNRTNHEV